MTQGTLFGDGIEREAILSTDGMYRYLLSRRWDPAKRTVAFICLNPSTADGASDDATVRKCVRFAVSWGAGTLLIANLFAFRSVDPRNLQVASDPVGPENDDWIEHALEKSDLIVAAWGCHGTLLDRDKAVANKLRGRMHALRVTKDGHPSHPLYLPESLLPSQFLAEP